MTTGEAGPTEGTQAESSQIRRPQRGPVVNPALSPQSDNTGKPPSRAPDTPCSDPMTGNATNPTDWRLLQAAAVGSPVARRDFTERYLDVIRSYLTVRWRGRNRKCNVDDAVQDVFFDCFKENGVLDRVQTAKPTSFRAFLYGVARNTALRHEQSGAHRPETPLEQLPQEPAATSATPSMAFDLAWARSTLGRAALRQSENAEAGGDPAALRRVELLRLRFGDDLPIREIARFWQVRPSWLHHQYAQARIEFGRALREELAAQNPESSRSADLEVQHLLEILEHGALRG